MTGSARVIAEMTLEEWSSMDEDEPGELIDGRIEDEEMPSVAHELVVAFLVRVLGAWMAPRGGFVLGSECKVAITPRRGRKADALVYFPGRALGGRRASILRAAPDIAIEVVTPTPRDGRRDRVEKRRDYAAIGVRQYWLVDPELRTVEILELGADGRFVDALAASEGRHEVPGCDGLTLDLDALWTDLDAWPDDDTE